MREKSRFLSLLTRAVAFYWSSWLLYSDEINFLLFVFERCRQFCVFEKLVNIRFVLLCFACLQRRKWPQRHKLNHGKQRRAASSSACSRFSENRKRSKQRCVCICEVIADDTLVRRDSPEVSEKKVTATSNGKDEEAVSATPTPGPQTQPQTSPDAMDTSADRVASPASKKRKQCEQSDEAEQEEAKTELQSPKKSKVDVCEGENKEGTQDKPLALSPIKPSVMSPASPLSESPKSPAYEPENEPLSMPAEAEDEAQDEGEEDSGDEENGSSGEMSAIDMERAADLARLANTNSESAAADGTL